MRVTHSFHPLYGRDLEFVTYRQNWGEDRVHLLPWRAAALAAAARSAPGRITIPLASAEITSSVEAVQGSGMRAA